MVDSSPVLPNAVIKDACLIVTSLLSSFISGNSLNSPFPLRGDLDLKKYP